MKWQEKILPFLWFPLVMLLVYIVGMSLILVMMGKHIDITKVPLEAWLVLGAGAVVFIGIGVFAAVRSLCDTEKPKEAEG